MAMQKAIVANGDPIEFQVDFFGPRTLLGLSLKNFFFVFFKSILQCYANAKRTTRLPVEVRIVLIYRILNVVIT